MPDQEIASSLFKTDRGLIASFVVFPSYVVRSSAGSRATLPDRAGRFPRHENDRDRLTTGESDVISSLRVGLLSKRGILNARDSRRSSFGFQGAFASLEIESRTLIHGSRSRIRNYPWPSSATIRMTQRGLLRHRALLKTYNVRSKMYRAMRWDGRVKDSSELRRKP